EAGVVGIGEASLLRDEGIEASLDLAAFAPEGAGGEAVSVLGELEGVSEHGDRGAGEADGAAALLLLQLAKILEEMGKAFLLRPAGEGVVIEGGGTVTGEDALEVVSQDLERDLVRAAAVDGVEGRLGAGEDPEPGALARDAPARVVAAH